MYYERIMLECDYNDAREVVRRFVCMYTQSAKVAKGSRAAAMEREAAFYKVSANERF